MSTFKRKTLSLALATGVAMTAAAYSGDVETGETAAVKHALTVYKSPACGCCGNWIKHMNAENFKIDVRDVQNPQAVKAHYGIEPAYQSCHTAVHEKDGYVFEGHVPGDLIRQFIQDPPAGAVGLAVAGMPVGSPGMEFGDAFVPYDVLLIKEDGSTSLYRHIDR